MSIYVSFCIQARRVPSALSLAANPPASLHGPYCSVKYQPSLTAIQPPHTGSSTAVCAGPPLPWWPLPSYFVLDCSVTLHSLARRPDSCRREPTPSLIRMWQNPISCRGLGLKGQQGVARGQTEGETRVVGEAYGRATTAQVASRHRNVCDTIQPSTDMMSVQ